MLGKAGRGFIWKQLCDWSFLRSRSSSHSSLEEDSQQRIYVQSSFSGLEKFFCSLRYVQSSEHKILRANLTSLTCERLEEEKLAMRRIIENFYIEEP
jgi:hypothetical protein